MDNKPQSPNLDPSEVDEFLVSLSGKEYSWRQKQPSLLNGIGLDGRSFGDMQTLRSLSPNLSILALSPLFSERHTSCGDKVSPLASRVFSLDVSRSDPEIIMETQRERTSIGMIQETQRPQMDHFCSTFDHGRASDLQSPHEWIGATQWENMPLKMLDNIRTSPARKFIKETPLKDNVVLETPTTNRKKISQTPTQKRCKFAITTTPILACILSPRINGTPFLDFSQKAISHLEEQELPTTAEDGGIDVIFQSPSANPPQNCDKHVSAMMKSGIEIQSHVQCSPPTLNSSLPRQLDLLAGFILEKSFPENAEMSHSNIREEVPNATLPMNSAETRKNRRSGLILPSISSVPKMSKDIIARLPIKQVRTTNEPSEKGEEYLKCSLSCIGLAWAPNRSTPSVLSPYRLIGRGSKWMAPISSKTICTVVSMTDDLVEIAVESATPNVAKWTRRLPISNDASVDHFCLSYGSEYFIRKSRSCGWKRAKLMGILLGLPKETGGTLGDISFLFLCENEVISVTSLKDISVLLDSTTSSPLFLNALEKPSHVRKAGKRAAIKPKEVISSYFCITGGEKMKKASVGQCGKPITTLTLLMKAIGVADGIPLLIFFSTAKRKTSLHVSFKSILSSAHRTAKLLAAAAAAITHRRKNIIFRLFPSGTTLQWTVDALSTPFPCFGDWAILGPQNEWRHILQAGGASLQSDSALAKNVLLVGNDATMEMSSFNPFEGKTVFTTETFSQIIIDRLVSVLVPI